MPARALFLIFILATQAWANYSDCPKVVDAASLSMPALGLMMQACPKTLPKKKDARDELREITKAYPNGSVGAAIYVANELFDKVGMFGPEGAEGVIGIARDNPDLLSQKTEAAHREFQELEVSFNQEKLERGGYDNWPTQAMAHIGVEDRIKLSQTVSGFRNFREPASDINSDVNSDKPNKATSDDFLQRTLKKAKEAFDKGPKTPEWAVPIDFQTPLGSLRQKPVWSDPRGKETKEHDPDVDRVVKKALGELDDSLEGLTEILDEYNDLLTQEAAFHKQAIARIDSDVSSGFVGRDQATAHLNNIGSDVGFLKNYFFSNMTTEEKVKAIKEGHVESDPETLRRLELTAVEERIHEKAAAINQIGQGAIKIAQHLGLPPEIGEKASKILTGGTAIVDTFSAVDKFLSVGDFALTSWIDPISAIASGAGIITGLFAKPKEDPVAKKLGFIIKQLNWIIESQQYMMKQLDTVLENQQMMVENQVKILESIISVSEQVLEQHTREMRMLDQISSDVMINRELIRLAAFHKVNMCETFFNAEVISRNYDPNFAVTGHFTSWDAMDDYFFLYGDKYAACMEGLTDVLQNPQYARAGMTIEHLKRDDNAHKSNYFLSHVYGPLMDSWRYLSIAPDHMAIPAFANPKGKLSELVRIEDAGISFREGSNSAQSLFSEMMSADILLTYAENLLQAGPYPELMARNMNELKSLDELAQTKRSRQVTVDLMASLLTYLDVAIAQQSLMAGEMIIPALYDHLENQEFDWKDASEKLEKAYACEFSYEDEHLVPLCMLKNNALLRRNYAKYFVRKRLDAHGKNLKAYSLALVMDENRLKHVLGEFTWQEDNQIDFGVGPVPLPTPRSIADDNMEYWPEMHKLLQMRERVYVAMTKFKLLGRHSPLSEEEQTTLRQWYLNQENK